MCNFISEFYCVQRGGGGRERVRENKNWEVNDDAFSGIRTGDLWITDPALYHWTTRTCDEKKILASIWRMVNLLWLTYTPEVIDGFRFSQGFSALRKTPDTKVIMYTPSKTAGKGEGGASLWYLLWKFTENMHRLGAEFNYLCTYNLYSAVPSIRVISSGFLHKTLFFSKMNTQRHIFYELSPCRKIGPKCWWVQSWNTPTFRPKFLLVNPETTLPLHRVFSSGLQHIFHKIRFFITTAIIFFAPFELNKLEMYTQQQTPLSRS